MDRQQIAPQNSQVAPLRIRCPPVPPRERAQFSSVCRGCGFVPCWYHKYIYTYRQLGFHAGLMIAHDPPAQLPPLQIQPGTQPGPPQQSLPAIEPAAQFYQMVPIHFNQGAPPKLLYSIEDHAGLRQGHLNIEDRVLPVPYTDPRAADRGPGRSGGVFPPSGAV